MIMKVVVSTAGWRQQTAQSTATVRQTAMSRVL